MYLIENFIEIKNTFKFIYENMDVLERSIERADLIYEVYFTEAWIDVVNE